MYKKSKNICFANNHPLLVTTPTMANGERTAPGIEADTGP